MDKNIPKPKLLLIDDEDDFRRATVKVLARRGFEVIEAPGGREALDEIHKARPDIVLLDLKMPEMGGIETLQYIRAVDPSLPVIILTGHGDFQTALAGVKLEIVDFIQKPVDIDQLAERIRILLERGSEEILRERTIASLMAPPAQYPRLFIDDPVTLALETLKRGFFQPLQEDGRAGQVRSALVFSRKGEFLGIIRFTDLLKLVLPPFLWDSPYTTFFSGMFLAQCKVIGKRSLREIMGERIQVNVNAPLMEAMHLMVRHHLINLPVMERGELAGVLRERDIILEIASVLGIK
jgi:DNA-binding response OmpR family regulator